MPYIDCKVTGALSEEKREALKTAFGKAVSILHKSERYLMVGFTDNASLYFAGKKSERGAYVSVSLYQSASAADCARMTGEVCRILEEIASIPARGVYVTYHFVENWGWNGENF